MTYHGYYRDSCTVRTMQYNRAYMAIHVCRIHRQFSECCWYIYIGGPPYPSFECYRTRADVHLPTHTAFAVWWWFSLLPTVLHIAIWRFSVLAHRSPSNRSPSNHCFVLYALMRCCRRTRLRTIQRQERGACTTWVTCCRSEGK